jgi:Lysozyme like domain/Bacterial TSP3 repeat/NlpC/P60 family
VESECLSACPNGPCPPPTGARTLGTMATYSAEQIYAFARQAGFSPDAATTMTAIALAESGGRSGAHNPVGEDSRGLWQINARAHPHLAALDLYDPAQNARAAFEVSGEGRNISPWTVTHGGASARYLHHRDAAQAAAAAHGDGPGLGVWSGTQGYGHVVAAGGPGQDSGQVEAAAAPVAPDEPAPGSALQAFLDAALAQQGDTYVFGANAGLDDPDPETFDCSELVEWAAHQAGVTVPDGAAAQYLHLKNLGMVVPVEEAVDTPGALLFTFGYEPRPGEARQSSAHVAISLGDGTVMEAANPRKPLGIYDAGSRFTFAAVIPGISDAAGLAAAAAPVAPPVVAPATPVVAPVLAAAPDLGGADTDGDGLTDAREAQDGTDPHAQDSDDDGLPDGWERANGSDPRLANTDGDLLPDAYEFSRGTDPNDPDADLDGHLDGALADSWVDVDVDGVDDPLEALLRLDPTLQDTDGDGFTDRLELDGGWDAADPLDLPTRAPEPDRLARAAADAADVWPT